MPRASLACRVVGVLLGFLLVVSPAAAHEAAGQEETVPDAGVVPDAPAPVLETVVHGRRPYANASESRIGAEAWAHRPLSDPSDLLEAVPGLLTMQHAGGGKANQLFLRGFDLDHGTDIALSVDGVPVNAVSHGHGQGYADLSFVVPELVERLDVQKGPYDASREDFATAGAADLVLRRGFGQSEASFQGGSFNTFRAFAVGAPQWSEQLHAYVAGEVFGTDGPFLRPERYRRFTGVGSFTYSPTPATELSLQLQASGGAWYASGQLPERAVRSGSLDRFGTLSPTDGGASQRQSARLAFHFHDRSGGQLQLMAYVVRQRLNLFSNFTFFLEDPVQGDQIEQLDARWTVGFEGHYARDVVWRQVAFRTRGGVRVRQDAIDNGLFHTEGRSRLDTRLSNAISEGSLGLWVDEDVTWLKWLRTGVGVRADLFGFQGEGTGIDRSVAQSLLVSPKASVVFTPLSPLDLYVSFGRGFHSNDARGVLRTVSSVTPLAPATGYEVGARARLDGGIDLTASLWALDLESELVWIGDEGSTEARPATRRRGVEVEARAHLFGWLQADVAVTVSRARFVQRVDGGVEVPLAPRLTLSGGLEAKLPLGFFVLARVQGLTDRPATPDRSVIARGFWLVDLAAGWASRHFRLGVTVQNLLNQSWNQAQFATESRLAGEAGPTTELHFTPGYPLRAMGNAAVMF